MGGFLTVDGAPAPGLQVELKRIGANYMGSFSIFHWIVVLLFLSPFFIGWAILGSQRPVRLQHAQSGLVKKGYLGFSWTYFLLGWLVPVARGETGIALLHFLLALFTLGVYQLIMPFLYNKQHMTRMLAAGWTLADDERVVTWARSKLGMATQVQ